jgi:hypothetical protein
MHRLSVPLLAVAVFACSTAPDQPVSPQATKPSRSVYNDPSGVDIGEGRLPDLVVDQATTQNNWVVRVEDFSAAFCSVQEGGVNEGTHAVLRFTVTTPNIGTADNYIGSPLQHFNAGDGLYEFASCHNHFHFKNYTKYELIDPATGYVWRTAKRGFCMLDTDPAPAWYGQPAKDPLYGNCGTLTRDGFQGISHGWSDTYVWRLAGQYFVLDGGDNQPPVPPGIYKIRITVNPPYAPEGGGSCPRVTAPDGSCRQFAELDYTNNVAEATIVIPDHPGRAGYGPLKGQSAITANDEIDHRTNGKQ